LWRAAALITAARDSKKKRLNPTNLWRPSALVTYPSNPGNALAIRGGSPGGGFVNRGEHLGEWVGFVLFRKSRRGFRRGGRFRRLLEILKGSPGRGSISACSRNRVIVLERGVDFVVFQKSLRASREEVDFVVFRKSLRASRGGGRFRHVSKISPSFSERRSISSCFRNLGRLSGEMVVFVAFQNSSRALRRGVILRRFQKKRTVGRADVWTVERLAKTWQKRCTFASHMLNVEGFKDGTRCC
jgi:hypothetical protein